MNVIISKDENITLSHLFDKLNIKFSRFLYPIQTIKRNILYECIKKKSFQQLTFWVCEFYNSGYFIESWEWMETVYFLFYSISTPKLGEKIGNLYKKWEYILSQLGNLSKQGVKINTQMNSKLGNKYNDLLMDLLYCYKNMFIKTQTDFTFTIYSNISKSSQHTNSNKDTTTLPLSKITKQLPYKSRGKMGKKEQLFYNKYYSNKQDKIGEDSQHSINFDSIIGNNVIINSLLKSLHKCNHRNICYIIHILQKITKKNENNVWCIEEKNVKSILLFLSNYISFFEKKQNKLINEFLNFQIITKFNKMKTINKWGLILTLSNLLYMNNNIDIEKKTINKLFVKLNDSQIEYANECSKITIFQDFICNYSGYSDIDAYKILPYFIGNNSCGLIKEQHSNLNDIINYFSPHYDIDMCICLMKQLPYVSTNEKNDTLNQYKKTNNSTNIQNIVLKNIYLYHWLYFCKNTPIWNKRLIQYSGSWDDNDKDFVFGDNDDDLLEQFYNYYNYEPDEQKKIIQQNNMGNIF